MRQGEGKLTATKHDRPAVSTRAAFSLVETVIVVLIIGVVAAVSVPKMIDSLSYQRALAAAQQVAAHLRLARHDARQRSATSSIQFSTANQSYTLSDLDDPDRPGRPYQIDCRSAPILAQLTIARFGDDQKLVFNGFGLPDTRGTVEFQVGRYTSAVTVSDDGTISIDGMHRMGS